METTDNSKEVAIIEPNSFPMEKLSFSVEELIHDVDSFIGTDGTAKSRQVCLCGHVYRAHKELVCQPNYNQCHCPQFNPVLESTNLRVFKRFSKGNGTLHALSQGIRALMVKGGSYSWLPDACFCYKCKKTDVKISPTLVSREGYKINFEDKRISDRVDIFLCEECNFNFEKNGTLTGW
jgi:hypothetical protein